MTADELQKEDELEGLSTLQTLSDLPSPQITSVSIITPPKVRPSPSFRRVDENGSFPF
jgi:hypothetical protein